MRRLVTMAFAAAMAGLAGCTTQANVSTGYYDVKGNSARALDKGLRRNGPMNGHALATTELRFKPDVRFSENPSGECRIAGAKIRIDAHITLPRWQERAGASQDLGRAFDGMAAYARKHEQVHVAIAEAAARSMEYRLKALPPQKSCAALERKGAAVINDVSKLHNKLQLKFDADEQKRLAAIFATAKKRR